MPLDKMGNTSGAKAGMSSTLKQGEDVGNSKGARPKEGEDRGAVGPDPQQGEDSSRETSPFGTRLPYTAGNNTAFCSEWSP